MQVNNIKNSTFLNAAFAGKILDTSTLQKFKSELSSADAKKFAKYVDEIEKVDDGKRYIYAPIMVGDNQISKIYTANENDIPVSPPMFVDYSGKPLNLFKQLYNLYN